MAKTKTRLIFVVEKDKEDEPLTIEVPVSWPKVFIFRHLQGEYGRCKGRTENGWKFLRATVTVEGAVTVPQWRLE